MKSSVQLSPSRYLENISKMFKKLYNDEQLTDVTLCCKDGTIKAHKLILATCSSYFHKIFTENNRDHPILIMHGVSYQNLHDLIELIYKGNVDVLPESLNPLYELAEEFQLSGITGVLREEGDKSSDGTNFRNEGGGHGRDTRFKGLKRVAVDYKDTDAKNETPVTPPKRMELSKDNPPEPTTIITNKKENASPETVDPENCATTSSSPKLVQTSEDGASKQLNGEEAPKLSAWDKKQRKFKCDLCPSSFKRSSHLTRHQLVHTGERPFACDQCHKAFSRPEKLKHHVRKTHEQDYETDYNVELSQSGAIGAPPSPPLPFIIAHVRSEANDEPATPPANPPKRPRGRPRKYPVVEKPLVKRDRGRPRLNPVRQEVNGENYITNLPYGDLESLTMPLQDSVMIESYVEIKTEKEDNVDENNEKSNGAEKTKTSKENEQKEQQEQEPTAASLKVLENKIAKIGECTISVANH